MGERVTPCEFSGDGEQGSAADERAGDGRGGAGAGGEDEPAVGHDAVRAGDCLEMGRR